MPLFRKEPNISLEQVESYVASTWSDVATFGDHEVDEHSVSFATGNALVVIGNMSAPVPWGSLEGPCATSVLWPEAKNELLDHKSHMIVTVSSDELTAVELSILLTKITAAVLAVGDGALGVFWSNAVMVVPRNLFIDFSKEVLPKGPPLHIWIDFRLGAEDSKHSSGFTCGLAALGLMEIEAVNSPEPVNALRDRLTGLAEYLIRNGLVIKDGDTMGEDEKELIRVNYQKSSFEQEGLVLKLDYSQYLPRKRKLKFW